MLKRIVVGCLLVTVSGWARDNASPWVEVRSPHFSVVTDAGETEGRRIADRFERMRWVLQTMFPKSNVDPVAPILVIAVRNRSEFQRLEPEAYRARGQVQLGGLFLRNTDKNYILLQLGLAEEHPFSSIYHEYTHLRLGTEGMPLWLNEGLAQFFQNTDISDKDVLLGQASAEAILYLRQNSPIPLRVLFQVDANSPYYHEEQKGTIFYAESWALTHYLEFDDLKRHQDRIGTYVGLVNQNEDPVTAATEAFGDLKELQMALEDYIHRERYQAYHLDSTAAPIDPQALTVTTLTEPQRDAVRADFLAYSGRSDDARALLDDVLKADSNNEQAHETMGFIEFRAGHRDAAKKWYAEAVALDPESYLAQYYLGDVSEMDGETGEEVEADFRAAIRVNPGFAPAYDGLAMLYGKRRAKLDLAHMLELQAVQLDPEDVNYRLNTANLLVEQERYDDALHVLRVAEKVARTPLEADVVERVMKQVEQHRDEMKRLTWQGAEAQVQTTVVTPSDSGASIRPVAAKHPTETPHGPDLTAQGVIRGVRCSGPGIVELKVDGTKGSVSLYSNEADKVDYRALNFTPKDAIQPCQDLEGMKARVHYFATADKTVDGQITIIALWK